MRAALLLSTLVLLLAACGSTATPSPSLGPTPSPSPSPSPTPEPTPTPSPTPVPTPSPTPLNDALLNSRLTVLVVGEDSNDLRTSMGLTTANTDAMMVVSLTADQSRLTMLSLPRDTVDIPMADGRLYRRKANSLAYNFGLPALQGAMATLLGVPIDGYIKVDMDDLVELVDAVGGIDIVVPTGVYDSRLPIAIDPGSYRMSGLTALSYSRSRRDGDYARAARQQQVLLSLVRAYTDPARAWNPQAVLALMDSLETSLDLAQLPTLIEMGRRSKEAGVVNTVLGPTRFALFEGFEPGTTRGWVMIPNVPEIRAYAQAVMGD